MTPARVFCAALATAIAAMALIGTGTAAATDQIVLCKTLVNKGKLCPKGELWGSGVVVLALAKNPIIKSSIATIQCEDAIITGRTTAEMGAPLPVELTAIEHGRLPTPKLGEGCTTCVGGIHTFPPYTGKIEVTGEDEFFVSFGGEAEFLNCFGLGVNCRYGAETIKSTIDNDSGEHPAALENPAGSGKHPAFGRVLITTVVKRTGGSAFCPSTGEWVGDYVGYAVDVNGEHKDAWLALDAE